MLRAYSSTCYRPTLSISHSSRRRFSSDSSLMYQVCDRWTFKSLAVRIFTSSTRGSGPVHPSVVMWE
ncbi:unnamed protein product [Cylicocyclus nassatus]|uniref:Uncharacterized protein n=1 Tax=Cylicocyclus nassatus TaxID=53992 RepID=A0AA36MEY6_CYLNA|nr:unnamed protein product [Cylicocyclus nassatus]